MSDTERLEVGRSVDSLLRDRIAAVITEAIPDNGTTTFLAVADAVIEALRLREERTETETVTNEQGATWFRQGGYRYVSEWIDND